MCSGGRGGDGNDYYVPAQIRQSGAFIWWRDSRFRMRAIVENRGRIMLMRILFEFWTFLKEVSIKANAVGVEIVIILSRGF